MQARIYESIQETISDLHGLSALWFMVEPRGVGDPSAYEQEFLKLLETVSEATKELKAVYRGQLNAQ